MRLIEIEKKVKELEEEDLRSDAYFLNQILPEELKRFMINQESIEGGIKKLRIKIKHICSLLNNNRPEIFKLYVEHFLKTYISEIEENDYLPPVRDYNKEQDEYYYNLLVDYFKKTILILHDMEYRNLIEAGFDFFLKDNQINPNIDLFFSIRNMEIKRKKENDLGISWKRKMENVGELENTLIDFFKQIRLDEKKLIFIGFTFWSKFIQLLKEDNVNIYISREKEPLINKKIYKFLSMVLKEKIENINESIITKKYDSIYDNTENYNYKIEPWLS